MIVKFSTFEAIVKEYKDQIVILFTVHEISSGNKYSILAGCDKTFSTCQNKFNNSVNFRGEPHIPMDNRLIR